MGGTEIKGFHGNFCYSTGLHSNHCSTHWVCYIYTYINVKLTSHTSHNPAFFKLGLNLLIIQSWMKEVLRTPAEVRDEPKKYITVITDGMDQNKTNLQIAQNTKSTQNLWRVLTHLTGALAHMEAVKGKLAFGFYDLLQWPHDCNLTIKSGLCRNVTKLRLIHHQRANLLLIRMVLLFFFNRTSLRKVMSFEC